jgi:hypothetical protein
MTESLWQIDVEAIVQRLVVVISTASDAHQNEVENEQESDDNHTIVVSRL